MKRPGICLLAAVLCCAAGAAVASGAQAPPGPRLSFIQLTKKKIEVRTVGPLGEGSVRIAGGGRNANPLPVPYAFDAQLSWSADGGMVAVMAFDGPVSKDTEIESAKAFLVFPDGRAPLSVPGTAGGMFPVLSPDGQSLAITRVRGRNGSESVSNGKKSTTRTTYARTSIWVIATDGDSARRLTPWRKRTREWPSSFSPDGRRLAVTQSAPEAVSRALVYDLESGRAQVIARRAGYPVYSPDGSKLALIRGVDYAFRHDSTGGRATAGVVSTTDLFVVDADGANPVRLTRTRAVDLSPSWDPSGQRLAFVSLGTEDSEFESLFGFNDSLMEVNADGSCATKVLSTRGVAYLGPSWQPGPGREAGPISCATAAASRRPAS